MYKFWWCDMFQNMIIINVYEVRSASVKLFTLLQEQRKHGSSEVVLTAAYRSGTVFVPRSFKITRCLYFFKYFKFHLHVLEEWERWKPWVWIPHRTNSLTMNEIISLCVLCNLLSNTVFVVHSLRIQSKNGACTAIPEVNICVWVE